MEGKGDRYNISLWGIETVDAIGKLEPKYGIGEIEEMGTIDIVVRRRGLSPSYSPSGSPLESSPRGRGEWCWGAAYASPRPCDPRQKPEATNAYQLEVLGGKTAPMPRFGK